jgi:hypothetical protein
MQLRGQVGVCGTPLGPMLPEGSWNLVLLGLISPCENIFQLLLYSAAC